MSFVQRETDKSDARFGKVKGVYRWPQPGYAEEEIADDHPDVQEFVQYLDSVAAKPALTDGVLATLLVKQGVITQQQVDAAVAAAG